MDNKKISVCIITKNECEKLELCINHLQKYTSVAGHEIVVVDTGSTDNTIEMSKKYTDSVYSFPWIDDFSAARNYAAQKAKNDWILVIDSDENVIEWNEAEIQHSLEDLSTIGTLTIINTCGFGKEAYQATSMLYRLYNKKVYTFCFPIHEQLCSIAKGITEKNVHTSITIVHNSYFGTKEELMPKAQRNISLLLKQLNEKPDDVFCLYNLGQSYYMIEDYKEALNYYSKGLEQDVDPAISWVKNMVVSYGYCLLNLNMLEKALELEGLYDTFAEYADFVFLIGYIYMRCGYIDDAVVQFEKATTLTDYKVIGSNSFRAWFNIGVIYECSGKVELAKEYYKKCGDYEMALERLKTI